MDIMRKYFHFNIKGIGSISVFPLILILTSLFRFFSNRYFPHTNPLIQNLITLIQFLVLAGYVILWLYIYLRAAKKNKAEAGN